MRVYIGPEDPFADMAAGGILAAYAGYAVYQYFHASSAVQDISGRPPFVGDPGSTVRGPKQSRTYGDDGYPKTDRDVPHHKAGDHAHDWGRPPGGGPPTKDDRSLPRDPKPTDPPKPSGTGSGGSGGGSGSKDPGCKSS